MALDCGAQLATLKHRIARSEPCICGISPNSSTRDRLVKTTSALLLVLTIALVLKHSADSHCATQQPTPGMDELESIGQPVGDSGWRRTAQGWRKTSGWPALRAAHQPYPASTRLHPLVVAALQVLVSVGALVYFTEDVRSANRDSSRVPDRDSYPSAKAASNALPLGAKSQRLTFSHASRAP